LMGVGRR
ncbi:methyltransferase domain protein, partial [Vibrio parahaemolyticus EKP-028]